MQSLLTQLERLLFLIVQWLKTCWANFKPGRYSYVIIAVLTICGLATSIAQATAAPQKAVSKTTPTASSRAATPITPKRSSAHLTSTALAPTPPPTAPPPATPPPPPTPPAIPVYNGRPNTYPIGQCTYYVASKRDVPNHWGDARNWLKEAQVSGFATGSSPRVGAIAWAFPGVHVSRAGHVALVVAVIGNEVSIMEENFNGRRVITGRMAPASDFYYIY